MREKGGQLIDWMLEVDETKRPASVAIVRDALQGNATAVGRER